jgi:hypothetical protein
MNLNAISPPRSRSLFLQNTVASHTGSSGPRPTNQRNNRLLVQLLHQLSFRANGEKRLQQERSQQALRWDRRSSFARVEPW